MKQQLTVMSGIRKGKRVVGGGGRRRKCMTAPARLPAAAEIGMYW
jgi:hypothetical protein